MSQTLLEIAKELVFAQIHAHKLSPEDMHETLRNIHDCLLDLHAQEASYGLGVVETPERQAPRNWKQSITKYSVRCLVCDGRYKQLSAHLKTHGLDASSYRIRFGIPRRHPLSARIVTIKRRQTAQIVRPWEKTQGYLKKQQQAQPVAKRRHLPKSRPSLVKK
jgi:predicted transcriptional regulator